MNKCLFCYQALDAEFTDFHPKCAKKIFGTQQVPLIDFSLTELETMGKQVVVKSIAVTGVQPKLSLALAKSHHQNDRLTLVGLHGNYILKPPSAVYHELPENEDLTMHLAALAGIKTAQHSLIRLASGELAYITKRFDRLKKEKIALEDFCQLSGHLTENKYRSSIEKIAKLTYQYTSNKGLELLRLFELVLFCYLTSNADMHLKNFALLENHLGEFELSPAYDLLNTNLLMPDDKEESALNINGKKNKLKRHDFDQLALNMELNPKALAAVYAKFNKIRPKWNAFIAESFLSPAQQAQYMALLGKKHEVLFG